MGYLVRNTARTTLSAGVLAGAGLLPVVNPAAFPAPTTAGLTGTVTTSGHTVTGVATLFQTELNRGDTVWANVGGQVELRYVVYIISEVLMIVDRAFSSNLAGAPLYSGVPVLLTLVEGIAYKEHVACYGVSGTDLQVIRAQDQSAAAAFSAGAVVELRVTKGLLEDLPDRAVWDVFALLADAALSSVITVSVPGVVATDLSGALQEIFDALAAHIEDVLGAHAAEAISFASGGWAAGNVKDAILEAFADAITALNAHAGASPAHDATQIEFSPYGPITATDVQGALEAIADIAISSGAEKIRDAVETAGLVWNAADDTLLAKAIGRYVHFSDYYTDSGTADALVLTPLAGFRVPPGGYSDGMRVRFRKNATNKGAMTIDVGGLGVKNILSAYSTIPITRCNWVAGEIVELVYVAAIDAFAPVVTPEHGAAIGTSQGEINFPLVHIDTNASGVVDELALPVGNLVGGDITVRLTNTGYTYYGGSYTYELIINGSTIVDTAEDPGDHGVIPSTPFELSYSGPVAWDTVKVRLTRGAANGNDVEALTASWSMTRP